MWMIKFGACGRSSKIQAIDSQWPETCMLEADFWLAGEGMMQVALARLLGHLTGDQVMHHALLSSQSCQKAEHN